MRFEESCFWTLSIVQSFFFKNNVSEAGSASVLPPPLFLPQDGSRASFRNVVFKEKTLDDG
jgi:hypothetical protein